MAIIDPIDITLKDGTYAHLRSPEPRDAARLNAFLIQSFKESDTLIHKPDEFRVSTWQQRRRIALRREAQDQLSIVAVRNGEILGHLDTMIDTRRRVRHNIEFGLAIAAIEQGIGLGRAMLEHYLAWARKNPNIHRVTLHVHATNERAQALYTSLGFKEEGRLRSAIQISPGNFTDNVVMGLVFTSEGNVS